MKDYLLELGKNRQARKIIGRLGLPIPMPQALERASGPWEELPLAGRAVAGRFGSSLESMLHRAGAQILPQDSADSPKALVFDATSLTTTAQLRGLYDFFHERIGRLARCGRVVVIGARLAGLPLEALAVQSAIEGFVRSLGKEIGKRGSTAQLIRVDSEAFVRLDGVLRFLLSPRSAFISGQVIEVTNQAAGALPASWTKLLQGKVAIVTGAARGIGAATAKLLAAEGAQVVVVDRPADEAAASEVARNIGGVAFGLDVAGPEASEKLLRFVQDRYGGVDVVVHNAGITRDKTLARMSAEQWDQVIGINLNAILRLTNALVAGPLLEGGRVVCLSSIGGIAGNVGQTNYAATKAGVIGLVRGLSSELAPRGITVNAVAPGFIETRMTAAVPFAIREAGRRMCSLGQGGQPEDVGQAITFLASPAAVGITGSVLRVCGQSVIGA